MTLVYPRPSFQPNGFARIGDGASIVAAKTKLIPSRQQFFLAKKPRPTNSTFCFVCSLVCGERKRFSYLAYGQNVRERLPNAAYKADVFFLTILRGSLKEIEKLREGRGGEKKGKLSSWNQFLTSPNSLSV